MRTLCSSKVAVHPASHSIPIDMRELWGKPGKIWASCATCGSCGRSKLQVVLVDWRLAPLGRPTSIGDLVVPSVLYGSVVGK
jgi:hypothetical protein